MKAVFGDTVYFLALVNPTDQYHSQAVNLTRDSGERLVTTEWVLMEVGDALSQPQNRPKFARLLELLRGQGDVGIVPASTHWFSRGCEFHALHADKEWSLTDCISFLVMREQKITDALTTDRHFEQAGFRRLLKE